MSRDSRASYRDELLARCLEGGEALDMTSMPEAGIPSELQILVNLAETLGKVSLPSLPIADRTALAEHLCAQFSDLVQRPAPPSEPSASRTAGRLPGGSASVIGIVATVLGFGFVAVGGHSANRAALAPTMGPKYVVSVDVDLDQQPAAPIFSGTVAGPRPHREPIAHQTGARPAPLMVPPPTDRPDMPPAIPPGVVARGAISVDPVTAEANVGLMETRSLTGPPDSPRATASSTQTVVALQPVLSGRITQLEPQPSPQSTPTGSQPGTPVPGSTAVSATAETPAGIPDAPAPALKLVQLGPLDYRHVTTWYSARALSGDMQPLDVAVGSGGRLYVADGGSNRILGYGNESAANSAWTAYTQFPGTYEVPMAIEVAEGSGDVYAAWRIDGVVRRQGGEYPVISTFLDIHAPDGSARRGDTGNDIIGYGPDDIDLDDTTGDPLVSAGGQIVRVNASVREFERYHIPGAGADPGRFAVLGGRNLAILRQAAGAILVLIPGSPWPRTISLGASVPLDVTTDEADNLHVLVRPSGAADPAAPLVLSYDPSGRLIRSLSAAELGASHPPATRWPWALDVGPGGLAFTTAGERFEIHRRDVAGANLPVIFGGPVRSSYVPPIAWDPTADSVALAPTADGGLLVVDNQWQRLIELDHSGKMSSGRRLPGGVADLAVNEDGEVFVSTRSNRLLRFPPGVDGPATWDVECDCRHGGRLALSGDFVYASHPAGRRISIHDARTGELRLGRYRADAAGWWPSDLLWLVDGRLLTADLAGRQVQAWRSGGAPISAWPFGLLLGPRRLADGQLADGRAVVAAVMADRAIEMHDAQSGTLLARWEPRLQDGRPVYADDIALGPGGRVFLAEAGIFPDGWSIHVFEPVAEALPTATVLPGTPTGPAPTPSPAFSPTPAPTTTATPTRSARSCTVSGDKVARPERIRLGETVDITLTLSADCPTGAGDGADIVLVVDVSGSMTDLKLASAKAAAQALLELVDFRYHRVGLVSFSSNATLVVALTDDPAALIAGLDRLQAGGSTNITAAVLTADAALRNQGRAKAMPVMVLLSDGQHTEANSGSPSTAAAAARDHGVQIFTIGLGAGADRQMLIDLAGDQRRFFFAPEPADLFPIYQQVLIQVLASLAGDLVIDDEMGAGIELLPGSARPPGLATTNRLRWGSTVLPRGGFTVTYTVVPQIPGRLPTNRHAVASYTDSDGTRREFVFPIPAIEVIGPTATATGSATNTPSPSPTRTPTWTPSPRPTATRVLQSVLLPLLLREACTPRQRRMDVVLVLDTSQSMLDPAAAGRTKLAMARAAVEVFLDQLQLDSGDQAALVTFDAEARVLQGLTADRTAFDRALGAIVTDHETCLVCAVDVADQELAGPHHRVGNTPVLVLLTDGLSSPRPASEAVDRAASAKDRGVVVFTVGIGQTVDEAALNAIASRSEYYHRDPGAEALETIYRAIAVSVPCPAQAFWGRR